MIVENFFLFNLHDCSEEDSVPRCISRGQWPQSYKSIQLLKSKKTVFLLKKTLLAILFYFQNVIYIILFVFWRYQFSFFLRFTQIRKKLYQKNISSLTSTCPARLIFYKAHDIIFHQFWFYLSDFIFLMRKYEKVMCYVLQSFSKWFQFFPSPSKCFKLFNNVSKLSIYFPTIMKEQDSELPHYKSLTSKYIYQIK